MESQPERVGPYTLVRKLGEGGMGVVHLARDPSGDLVAVKTMRPELAAREEFRRRFGKEAEAARRVARFCTAPVLDAGFDGGVAYLVTEYVEGPDLAGAVRRQGPLTGSNLEALAVGVATALAAIHQAGVVHRDLKPSNVLLSAVGPRVIDFGIAQLADPADPSTLAHSMGTPAYMSPEQAKGEQVTPAGDIFAWGSLMTFAGTGRPPFGTGGVAELVYRVVNHAPVLDGLDERIRSLAERALDKDPVRRPTAQQLLDRLLGRTEVHVDTATKVVTESWTPVVPPSVSGAPAAFPSPHTAASPPATADPPATIRPPAYGGQSAPADHGGPAVAPGAFSAPGGPLTRSGSQGASAHGGSPDPASPSGSPASPSGSPGSPSGSARSPSGSPASPSGSAGRGDSPASPALGGSPAVTDGSPVRGGSPASGGHPTPGGAETPSFDSRAAPHSRRRGHGPEGGGSPPPRRLWVPVLSAVLAAAAGVGVTLAVVRPWESPAGEPGTPATATTIDALGSKLNVRVDALVREGGTIRLQWTVKNVGEGNAPMAGKLGGGALDGTVSRVSLVPPGVGAPIYPARKDGACQCTDIPYAPFQGGEQVQLYAIYENVPESVERVDVDMGPLGVIENVAVTPA